MAESKCSKYLWNEVEIQFADVQSKNESLQTTNLMSHGTSKSSKLQAHK